MIEDWKVKTMAIDEILEKVDFYKRNASIHQTPPETWAELEDWILSFIKKEANDETK